MNKAKKMAGQQGLLTRQNGIWPIDTAYIVLQGVFDFFITSSHPHNQSSSVKLIFLLLDSNWIDSITELLGILPLLIVPTPSHWVSSSIIIFCLFMDVLYYIWQWPCHSLWVTVCLICVLTLFINGKYELNKLAFWKRSIVFICPLYLYIHLLELMNLSF